MAVCKTCHTVNLSAEREICARCGRCFDCCECQTAAALAGGDEAAVDMMCEQLFPDLNDNLAFEVPNDDPEADE